MAAKGQPKTGGRQKGTPNQATADIKAVAQEHGPAAIKKLVKLMGSKDERIQHAACKELLDRGYGKAPQAITGLDAGPVELRTVLEVINGTSRGLPTPARTTTT